MTDALTQINLAIQDSPSLKNYPAKQLEQSYQRACCSVSKQTGLSPSVLPKECPYSLELVLDKDWLPGEDH